MKNGLIALLLLPLFFLLHNYNELFGFMDLQQMLVYALAFYLILLPTYFLMKKWLRSADKSSLILFLLGVYLLLFGPIHFLVRQLTGSGILSSYKFFLPCSFMLLIFFVIRITRSKSIPARFIAYLNMVMICLLLVESGTLVWKFIQFRKDHNLIHPEKNISSHYAPLNRPDSAKPDIFFLVFDEYTNNKTLKRAWNFDNREITDWLDSNGFYCPQNTNANYTFTPYSISSTFNLDYIHDVPKSIDATIPLNILQAVKSLSDNETFSILKKENYRIRFIAPFRNNIEEPGLDHFFQDLADEQLYRQTLVGSVDADILWNFRIGNKPLINDSIRNLKKLKQKFENTKSTISQILGTINPRTDRKPQFVYGHFLITHGPHIFDEEGRFLAPGKEPEERMPKTYISQIRYANKVLHELVARIRSGNKPNTIIVIEGDHGFRQFPGRNPEMYFPNFLAVYFPDRNYSAIHDQITPINLFRLIFNQYFDQHFPMLKDSSILVRENKY